MKPSSLELVQERFGAEPDPSTAELTTLKNRMKLWADAAKTDKFQELVSSLENRVECKSKPWKRRKAIRSFTAPMNLLNNEDSAERDVQKLGENVLSLGYVLIANDILLDEKFNLLLFPTNDKYEVLIGLGTNGANYGLDCIDVVRWLQEMEKENPFQLVAATHDGLTVFFPKPVANPEKLSESILKFCPDSETAADIAASLKTDPFFTFWWD